MYTVPTIWFSVFDPSVSIVIEHTRRIFEYLISNNFILFKLHADTNLINH